MITLLIGENSFAVTRELRCLEEAFEAEPERFDGEDVTPERLPDLLTGVSLFSERRLIIIRHLSDNPGVWVLLPDYLSRIADETHVVLVEPKPDKRTAAYKALQKQADVKEFPLLTSRDMRTAERWAAAEAKRLGVKIDAAGIRMVIERSQLVPEKGQPVIDQWRVVGALEKLSVLGTVTSEVIAAYVEASSTESVFALFETALRGEAAAIRPLVAALEVWEDAYKVLGLLSVQAFQLAVLREAGGNGADALKAAGIQPFVARQLGPAAARLQRSDTIRITSALTRADEAVKTGQSPWLMIELALTEIAANKTPLTL